jgi:single-stranded-DNA-specific exonuclease
MRWDLKTADTSVVERLTSELISRPSLGLKNTQDASVLAHLLVMRGITDSEVAEKFLNPHITHLHSPYLMSGMKAAVDRIEAAIENQEPILIYGDYDVDGTTAIVVLKTAIELCGGTAEFHVPHRIRDGYDMRDDVIEKAAAAGIKLIVSVDMGIRAFTPAQTARRLGVDLIVTDHHLPGSQGIPEALVVLNPNQSGCAYPCKELCGAGVAFKLAQGLIERRIPESKQRALLFSFMKVVAIATIADAVPLTGENRVFARLGLEGLRAPVNAGLKALLEVAQLGNGRALTSGEVAFRIAPRINAAGRMDVARDVIELFSVKDAVRAREIADKLDHLNSDRQDQERSILQSIATHFAEQPSSRDAFCIVIDGEGWHRGVIGITATRVVERYGRPALVISRNGEEAHGSGRSIRAFHLLNALESCAGLFTRFGGHAHAVGFSLPSASLPELRARLDAYARSRLTLADFEPSLAVDANLFLGDLTPELFSVLERLEPFGVGNPQPVFAGRTVRLMASPRIIKDKHAKLKLAPAVDDNRNLPNAHWRQALTFDALGWHMGQRCQQAGLLPNDTLDIAFTVNNNDHPEYGGLELSLRDFMRVEKIASDISAEEGKAIAARS